MSFKNSNVPSNKGNGACHAWLLAHLNHEGEGCLTWPFGCTNDYGIFGHMGEVHYAHVYMCSLVKGPRPSPDHDASHSCGRGHLGCIHPKHLDWKTRSQNQLDRREHGTANVWGCRGKLTPEQAEEIRRLAGTKPQHEIAAQFGVSRSTVSWVVTGKTWKQQRIRQRA